MELYDRLKNSKTFEFSKKKNFLVAKNFKKKKKTVVNRGVPTP